MSQNRYAAHAVLWRGSASSVVDLHPNRFSDSYAWATDGTTQAGSGDVPGKGRHALKWSGSADSVVDLDPNGFNSAATGVAGDQIVGYSTDIHGGYHALLWTGRGLADLNPNGFGGSLAFGTDGIDQVGSG